ncbi:hypothetical protein FA13DRAFT_1730123 [Coprinellus micaceus]|uniref:Uncharacterized protein n=1 Tax=Coprinellus micaceus TaxID=71717 RepID=A0A4Y7TIP4_COPMI|nr:hypothetical protein FA13DRAFT_1730123 [Coprinellus micaceus]
MTPIFERYGIHTLQSPSTVNFSSQLQPGLHSSTTRPLVDAPQNLFLIGRSGARVDACLFAGPSTSRGNRMCCSMTQTPNRLPRAKNRESRIANRLKRQ